MHDPESGGVAAPLDVLGRAECALDGDQQAGKLGDLRVSERQRRLAILVPGGAAEHNRAVRLPDADLVRFRAAVDQRRAEAADRIDHELVGRPGHRIARERHACSNRIDHGLDQNGGAGRARRQPARGTIRRGAIGHGRRAARGNGRGDPAAGNIQEGFVNSGKGLPGRVLARG